MIKLLIKDEERNSLKMKNKCVMAVMVVAISTLFTGCRLTNMDDVNSMSGVDIKETITLSGDDKESDWRNDNEYRTLPSGENMPPMMSMDNAIKVDAGKKNELECKVEEAYVTEDFKDVYSYGDSESIEELVTYLNEKEKNNYIDEETNICSSPKGIDRQMVIFRINITNKGEEDVQFLSTSFKFYDIKNNNNNVQYNTIYDGVFRNFLIQPDGWGEHEFCGATIKAKESREVVLLCFLEKYKVTKYKSKIVKDETGKINTVYWDVKTDGLLLDNDMYIGTNYTSSKRTGRPEIWDEKELVKIDFTYSDKLK